MNFRIALPEDLPFIVDIYNSTIESRLVTADTIAVTTEQKKDWFYEHNSETRPLWIVEKDGLGIGWASFQNFYGRPAYSGTAEVSIYLSEKIRGKGYGKEILSYCIKTAPKLNLHTLLGFIFSHNVPSIKLFEQAGFSEWGYYPDIAVMDGKFYSLKIFGIKIKQ